MDREQARFILRSFRPHGADSGNPDFEEALSVASVDGDLGAWLEAEQTQDASISLALGSVPVPGTLRNRILAALQADEGAGDSGEDLAKEERASSGVQPVEPTMEKSEMTVLKVEIAGQMGMPFAAGQGADGKLAREGERWVRTALAAIFLVLGAFVAFELTGSGARPGEEKVQDSALKDLEGGVIAEVTRTGFFSLEIGDLREHEGWLRKNLASGSVHAASSSGILGGRLVGSRFFEIQGSRASHFCFDINGKPIHLVALPVEDFTGVSSGKEEPRSRQCLDTGMSVALWPGPDRILLLVGKLPDQELLELFKSGGVK
jgi:hypothetical protein